MIFRTTLYQQILKTYWQRPLILLLTVMFFILVLSLAFGPTGGNVMQVGARPHAPGQIERVYTAASSPDTENTPRLQTLPDLLQQVAPAEIQSLSLARVNMDDSLPDLKPFRNLVYLELNDFVLTAENVEQICQLPKLDALVLMGTLLPSGALQHFGEKVSQLEIQATTLEAHSSETPNMTNVRLLALHYNNTSPELFQHVTQIPALQQLSLVASLNYDPRHEQSGNPQTWNAIDLSQEQIELLRSSPTLKEVYADWFLMKRIRRFHESDLLPVRALPITYSKSKLGAIQRAVFTSALLFATLSLQLWALFVTPAARLTPNYLAPHRRLAIAIMATGSLLLSLVLLRYDIGMLPAVSIILLLPAIVSLFSVAQLSNNPYRHWLILALMPLFFMNFPLLFDSIFKAIATEVIWYLQGHRPGMAFTFIVIEVLSVSWILIRFPAITEKVNEAFMIPPAFSPWDKNRARQAQWQKPGKLSIWLLDRSMQELHYTEKSTWQMACLWRRGNAFRLSSTLGVLGIIVIFGLLVQGIYHLITGEQFITQNIPLLVGLFSSLCSTGVFLPVIIWWQRRKNLEIESLRPVSRHSLMKQVYLAFALDHSFLVIGFLVLLPLLTLDVAIGKLELFSLMLLVGIAIPLWILGTNATVLVFKRAWMIVGCMFALYTLAGTVVISIIAWQYQPRLSFIPDLLTLFVSALIAIAGALSLNVLVYRAALKREWG